MAVDPRQVAQRAQKGAFVRFLISRFSSLGDVVCTLPAAVALKRSFPRCEVTWVVDPRFADIVRLCKSVDHVHLAQRKLLETCREVRTLGDFDAAFDLQGLLKSGLAVGCCRAKKKLGYHWRREGSWLFSQRVVPDETSLHVTDQYVDVVRAAGATMDRAEFDLAPDPEDLKKIRSLVPESARLALCNAGAGWATKRWPASSFARLADRLMTSGWTVAFIGGPSDDEIVQEVYASGAMQAINLTGKTNIRELVALVSLAGVHIGGDTGSTHIAAALGVPAVGLYSVTRPERSCPYGQRANTLYHPDGLQHIGPEQALQAVERAVSHNKDNDP